MRLRRFLCARGLQAGLALLAPHPALAQLVQPVIAEYTGKASGRLALTNNTMEDMAVVLEPKSFSLSPEGHGTFRPLDDGIHVELSTMSVTLHPQETYYIFYRADAERLPAWFTIYSTFSPMHHGQEVQLRIQLPHTVYLYQKRPLQREDIHVSPVTYSATSHTLRWELTNEGDSLGRVQSARANGPHGALRQVAGFPMLPGMTRRVEMEWKEKDPPTQLQVIFEHFTLTPAIAPDDTAGSAVASTPVR